MDDIVDNSQPEVKYYDTYEQYCNDLPAQDHQFEYYSLNDILNDQELSDSFKIVQKSSVTSPDQRLIDGFEEINLFIDEHKKIPLLGTDVQELKLSSRLRSIQQDPQKIIILENYDRHSILAAIVTQNTSIPNSLDDIIADYEYDIFDPAKAEEIFTLKHVPSNIDRASADFIARRKPCKNFAKYEPLFKQCQADLKSGKRKLITFVESKLKQEKTYFVVNGILGYLETIYDLTKNPQNSKLDGRIYCVFENGTESNLLFRSLGKLLYDNGWLVSTTQEEADNKFKQEIGQQDNSSINDNDQHTGHIYILKSKSKDPKISEIENLYKIGYCIGSVDERIKNAINEPTYLNAPVEIITSYKCYNLNPQKLEAILHRLFKPQCLNIDIAGTDSIRYSPREWFILPIKIIMEAINLIDSGEITKYHYDHHNQSFELLTK